MTTSSSGDWSKSLCEAFQLLDVALGVPVMVDFEEIKVPLASKYKELLTLLYGDYMTPPPVEQRVPKHQIIN